MIGGVDTGTPLVSKDTALRGFRCAERMYWYMSSFTGFIRR